MNTRWLLRAKRLAQNPPSWGRVKLFAAIFLVCLAVFLIERYIGWPEWMTVEPQRGRTF